MRPRYALTSLILLASCIGEVPDAEPCRHAEYVDEVQISAHTIDLLIVIDPGTVAGDIGDVLAAHLRRRFETDTLDDIYAAVVSADPCSPEFGEFVDRCGGLALMRSHRFVSTPDALIETMACRAQSEIAADACPWDPASALERVLTRHELPRDGHLLDVVLITGADVEEFPGLDPSVLGLSIIAGYRGDAPLGCDGDVQTALPPTRLDAWARELQRRGASVEVAALCGSDWDDALHGRVNPCSCIPATCLRRRPIVVDGLARCEILERLPADAPVSRCTDLPGREPVREDDLGLCRIRQSREGAGFYLRDEPNLAVCGEASAELEINLDLMPGAHVTLRCQSDAGEAECAAER